jgi:hypothetical protein
MVSASSLIEGGAAAILRERNGYGSGIGMWSALALDLLVAIYSGYLCPGMSIMTLWFLTILGGRHPSDGCTDEPVFILGERRRSRHCSC